MVAYVRVSTGKQARSGLGLEAQKQKIQAAADYHGWVIVGWRVDRGETGKNTHRPAFRAALQMVANHEVDGLVAMKIDRVARSVQDFSALLNWFVSAGKTLSILDPELDTSTPNGRLVAHILSGVAEWEAETIASRTSDALQAKRASGKAISRPSVCDEPVLAERILRMREQGSSLGAIAAKLNQDGTPTMRGGRAWRASSIQRVLGYQRPRKTHKAPDLPKIRRAAGKRRAA
jgi:DNA invertase Pin-like site-specific DNA recombinase